jgi:uncharacterized protein YaiI (UPF0178 family)
VAKRYDLSVTLVAGSWMRVPEEDNLALKLVGEGMDAADDWIVEHLEVDDIVITADIPLAARCLEKTAHALGPTGKPFTKENIGSALATRDLLSVLRDSGEVVGGPPRFDKRDRSHFLHRLDETINAIRSERA